MRLIQCPATRSSKLCSHTSLRYCVGFSGAMAKLSISSSGRPPPIGCWSATRGLPRPSSICRCFAAVGREAPSRALRPSNHLDDGIIAGDIPAVAAALAHAQQRSLVPGFRLNGNVSDAQLTTHFSDAMLRTAQGESRVCRSFELLGVGIGENTFVAAHTAGRIAKASKQLEAIREPG